MKRGLMYRCCLFVILSLSVFITSCDMNFEPYFNKSKDNNKKTNLVIIAGIHSNSEIMNMYSEEKITEIYSDFGDIRVIVADGNPEVAIGENGKAIGYLNEDYLKESQEMKQNNEFIWETEYLGKQKGSLLKEIEKLEPDDPEVNTLEAIFEAVDILDSISDDNDDQEIIIYDTGLCTSGEFSFTDSEWKDILFDDKELEDVKIQTMIETLKSGKLIPELSNIKVTWYGLGKTAAPQDTLNKHQVENLERIWGEILKSAGAISTSESGEDSYFFPIQSYGQTNYSQSVTPISADNYSTKLPKIKFKKESSKFVSPKEAMSVLQSYAKDILSCPDENILIVGTTADPNRNGGSISLSKKRAKKVKKCLVDLGVPENRLKILGWGANSPLYDQSEWKGGIFIGNTAKENRAVYIMSEMSEEGQKILAKE